MNNKILCIEDKYNDYEGVFKELNGLYDFFPDISTKKSSFTEFKLLCYEYLIDPSLDTEKLLIDFINTIDPDLFIIDIALFEEDYGSKIDFTGGKLRKELLAKHYPDIPTIFLTQYLDHEISFFKKEGDVHVYKFEFGHTFPNLRLIQHLNSAIRYILNSKNTNQNGIQAKIMDR